MYTFVITDKFLSKEETNVFQDYIRSKGLDDNIWEIYNSLFKSKTKHTKPLLLRVYKDANIYGAAVIIKCNKYGKSLFNNYLLSKLINLFKIPFYLWMKFGCCMDMMSNPGFVKDPKKADEVFRAITNYLKKNTLLTIINDYSINSELYHEASILPALPHALIDCSSMTTILDYTTNFKNIKRKIRVFKSKGGEYKRISQRLSQEQILSLKNCFLSTTKKSVFYLPYQDLYLSAAVNTSLLEIKNAYYFVATLNGEFLGYQAAIQSGSNLNALHGAFNRNLKTTYHAYDILFVKMTEFAIENRLKMIDFGSVINLTKQKMINKSIEMSYFIISKYSLVQKIFNLFLKSTKIQGNKQMKFRNSYKKLSLT
jgi:Acetyltransferase (GNAT) domain